MVRGLPGVDPNLQLPTTQVLSRQLHCVRRIRFFSRGQLQVWARTQQNITTEKKWPHTAPESTDPMQVRDRISNKKQLNKQKMAINLLGALNTDIHRPKTIWKFGIKKFWKFCCLWSRNKTYINYKFGIWRPRQKSLNFSIHINSSSDGTRINAARFMVT